MKDDIKVRIAPSPTGYLHIGTARTALFNYLFAKKYKGKFLLRIEDTDVARNNEQSYNSILQGLEFLGLNWEEEVIYQSKRLEIHKKYALKLIESGFAYYCYLPVEEIENRKNAAIQKGTRYIHKYNASDEIPHNGINPVVRIKVPRNLDIINNDLVQGKVTINSETIEDFVILRSDGSPVYMLSVVCDDIDMGITHVIRGDDHLTNTPKQILIYNGLNAKVPLFAHIPLIHGSDGKKLSKRHGALALEEYRQMGYLPEALRSYLIHLGWGSNNDGILNDEDMVREFTLEGISKNPARFDFEKLNNINHHFMQSLPLENITELILKEGDFKNEERIKKAVSKIRYRYNTILQLKEDLKVFEEDYVILEDARACIKDGLQYLNQILTFFLETKTLDNLEVKFKEFLKDNNIEFSKIGKPLRGALIGRLNSLSIFEIVNILEIEEVCKRVKLALKIS